MTAQLSRLVPGRGPLLRAADPGDALTRRRLERAWAAGRVVRLAPGVCCDREDWLGRPPWDRFTLAAVAHAMSARTPPVFAGLTAAHLHGLPVAETPEALTVRAARPGHTGRRPLTRSPAAPRLSCEARSHGRRIPSVPDLAPRWSLPTAPRSAPVALEARLSDGVVLGPLLADSLSTVQLVVGSGLPWADAIPVLDGLQRREPADGHRWALEADGALPSAAARRRFHAAWAFADGLAESAGESRLRALIHDLGFVTPELQRAHHDHAGQFVGRTDLWWDSCRVAGEFDGIGKYDVDLHADAQERRRALRREKTREVRLQRVTRRVLHWTWDDLADPAGVARSLREAGVPTRPPASAT